MMRFSRRRRRQVRTSRERAAQSESLRERVEKQWPEVRGLASWAKNTREQNHLTELFLASRAGGER